jgi:hypothetical protein
MVVMKIRTISLPDELDQAVAQSAQAEDRSYSSFVRRLLESALPADSTSRTDSARRHKEHPNHGQ